MINKWQPYSSKINELHDCGSFPSHENLILAFDIIEDPLIEILWDEIGNHILWLKPNGFGMFQT